MMSTEEDTSATCANCGKGEESSGDLKACTACKLVKYCNRECQIAHRPLHKKACKKRAAELHDEALFKYHPPREECPICFSPLPLDACHSIFKSCCGKLICNGCIYAMVEESHKSEKDNKLCAFCRTPSATSNEEENERIKKLAESGNAIANYHIGAFYYEGVFGFPLDLTKANELWLRAGELGHAGAYNNLSNSYHYGRGVEVDEKKAAHYLELAAMNGLVQARHNLGCAEGQTGNLHRAMKHFILSARTGYKLSLDKVKEGFMLGYVTKDEYADTLRAYQRAQDEMKSEKREKARAEINDGVMIV